MSAEQEQPVPAALDADSQMPEAAGNASKDSDEAPADEGQIIGQKRKLEEGDAAPEPVKLGYRTFTNVDDARIYFQNIIKTYKTNLNLNEYELVAALDLLQKGHPRAAEKLKGGVKAIQVQTVRYPGSEPTRCFVIIKKNGGSEDFSCLKCLQSLFPGYVPLKRPHSGGSSGRGRGGGFGRGGRSGGRGRGRGGGRGGGRGSAGGPSQGSSADAADA